MVCVHGHEHLVVQAELTDVLVSIHEVLASSKQCASPALHLHIVPEPMETLCRIVVHNPMPLRTALYRIVPDEVPCRTRPLRKLWTNIIASVILVLVAHVKLKQGCILVLHILLVFLILAWFTNHEMLDFHLGKEPRGVALLCPTLRDDVDGVSVF